MSALEAVRFRTVMPTDIPRCHEIEKASYPAGEAASRSSLQYRQHQAEKYFRCAVLGDEDEEIVIGFICATRCKIFDEESMVTHDSTGPLLAVHSVVVDEQYRRQGVAAFMMKDYVETMRNIDDGVERLVLISKADLLAFYVKCGFAVLRPSAIVHGDELWYHLEMDIRVEKGHPGWVVDSFTETAGCGNPAGIILLPESTNPDDDDTRKWMQVVAKEFNLSETAFVWPKTDLDDSVQTATYGIRYYTPKVEVDLCGHATLASAAILFQTLPFKVKNDATIVFEAKKDVLTTKPYVEGTKTWTKGGRSMKISMDFPQKKLTEISDKKNRASIVAMLEAAFPAAGGGFKAKIIYMGLDEDGGDLLIELTNECFKSLGYDNILYRELLRWDGYTRGVIVCCAASEEDEGIDFMSRFFGPNAGIDEDPVTGSAHCTLAPYFCEHVGKTDITGRQASERGGMIQCILGDGRVTIIGTAVTTMSGFLWIGKGS